MAYVLISALRRIAPATTHFKSKHMRDTLCLHRGSPRIITKSFSQNNFR
jgi:hypothetical protein